MPRTRAAPLDLSRTLSMNSCQRICNGRFSHGLAFLFSLAGTVVGIAFARRRSRVMATRISERATLHRSMILGFYQACPVPPQSLASAEVSRSNSSYCAHMTTGHGKRIPVFAVSPDIRADQASSNSPSRTPAVNARH
jgi:hypothetical protein